MRRRGVRALAAGERNDTHAECGRAASQLLPHSTEADDPDRLPRQLLRKASSFQETAGFGPLPGPARPVPPVEMEPAAEGEDHGHGVLGGGDIEAGLGASEQHGARDEFREEAVFDAGRAAMQPAQAACRGQDLGIEQSDEGHLYLRDLRQGLGPVGRGAEIDPGIDAMRSIPSGCQLTRTRRVRVIPLLPQPRSHRAPRRHSCRGPGRADPTAPDSRRETRADVR